MAFFNHLRIVRGFRGGSVDEESACNAGDEGRRGLDPREGGLATHSAFSPGESHGQRSLMGRSPWGHVEAGTSGPAEHACTRASMAP